MSVYFCVLIWAWTFNYFICLFISVGIDTIWLFCLRKTSGLQVVEHLLRKNQALSNVKKKKKRGKRKTSAILFFFFFFTCGTGVWTQQLHLEPLEQTFFVMGIFQDRVSWSTWPDWLWSAVLLISASWVVRVPLWAG
jgi:hypothetical protein